jgi:hypothetical protein
VFIEYDQVVGEEAAGEFMPVLGFAAAVEATGAAATVEFARQEHDRHWLVTLVLHAEATLVDALAGVDTSTLRGVTPAGGGIYRLTVIEPKAHRQPGSVPAPYHTVIVSECATLADARRVCQALISRPGVAAIEPRSFADHTLMLDVATLPGVRLTSVALGITPRILSVATPTSGGPSLGSLD